MFGAAVVERNRLRFGGLGIPERMDSSLGHGPSRDGASIMGNGSKKLISYAYGFKMPSRLPNFQIQTPWLISLTAAHHQSQWVKEFRLALHPNLDPGFATDLCVATLSVLYFLIKILCNTIYFLWSS